MVEGAEDAYHGWAGRCAAWSGSPAAYVICGALIVQYVWDGPARTWMSDADASIPVTFEHLHLSALYCRGLSAFQT